MTIYKKIGAKIRKARLQQGLSQEELAEKCNLSTSYISCVERGTKKINLDKLFIILSLLNLVLDIYPESKTCSKFLVNNDFLFLDECTLEEEKFFYNAIKCLIIGIKEKGFYW